MRRGVRAEGAGERREEGHLHRGRQLEVGGEPEPVPRLQRSADVGLFRMIFLSRKIALCLRKTHFSGATLVTLYTPKKMQGTYLISQVA